jgi:hypothetical protein
MRRGFKTGDLAWVSALAVRTNCAFGRYIADDRNVALDASKPLTIIRGALAKDLSKWARRAPFRTGMSWARHLAMRCWIVLHNDMILLVTDDVMKKRHYKANRKCDSGVTRPHTDTPAGEIQETLGDEDGKEEESCQGNLCDVPL